MKQLKKLKMKRISLLLLMHFSFANISQGQNSNWQTGGNGGLNQNAFIGTTDQQPLMLKTNGQERLRVTGAGEVVLPSLGGNALRFVMTDSTGRLVPGPRLRQGDPGLDSLFDCETILWTGAGNNISPYCKIGTLNNAPFRIITNGQDRMRITPAGLVGIRTFNPRCALQIGDAQAIGLHTWGTQGMVGFNLFTDGTQLRYQSNGSGAVMKFNGATGVLQIANSGAGLTGNVATLNPGITINSAGYVGINTINPLATLHVDGHAKVTGTICTREVRVALQGNGCWPDYVFENGYEPIGLDSLAAFVAENHHLPGVPSAAEVEKNGVELGELNQAMLKQMEELTLYVVELKGQVELLQGEIGELKRSEE
jgi:hypothetical protein